MLMTEEKLTMHLRVYTEIGKLMHVLFLHNHYSILMQCGGGTGERVSITKKPRMLTVCAHWCALYRFFYSV